MTYRMPDDAEKWLRENDPDFGKGEHPYHSRRQTGHRYQKEITVDPQILDGADFSVLSDNNFGTRGTLPMFQKDRHRRGQRDTEID